MYRARRTDASLLLLWVKTTKIPLVQLKEIEMHFIWVSMFLARKYQSRHYFYVSYLRPDRHFTWSSEPRQDLAARKANEVPSFLSIFKTLSIGLAPRIEPVTSLSAFKRSTDWDNTEMLLTSTTLPTQMSALIRKSYMDGKRSKWLRKLSFDYI